MSRSLRGRNGAAVGGAEAVARRLPELVEELTTAGEPQLDARTMKELKKICKYVREGGRTWHPGPLPTLAAFPRGHREPDSGRQPVCLQCTRSGCLCAHLYACVHWAHDMHLCLCVPERWCLHVIMCVSLKCVFCLFIYLFLQGRV